MNPEMHPPSEAGPEVPTNPYQAPVAPVPMSGAAAFDPMLAYQDDIGLTTPTALVKAGAILTLVTGLIAALVGLQLLLTVTFYGGFIANVPYLLLGGGGATMFLGLKTYRTRGFGAIGATATDALLALGMGYWVLFTASAGYFSLLALVLPPLAVVAAVFAGLSIGPCQRAEAARARLREAGIEMSF